jgi:hypothetical protein
MLLPWLLLANMPKKEFQNGSTGLARKGNIYLFDTCHSFQTLTQCFLGHIGLHNPVLLWCNGIPNIWS